jgi:hypothetical protein
MKNWYLGFAHRALLEALEALAVPVPIQTLFMHDLVADAGFITYSGVRSALEALIELGFVEDMIMKGEVVYFITSGLR